MNPQTGTGSKTTQANPVAELRQQGQSIWLDYIRRSLIESGELKRLMEEKGVTGMTSNPTIFDKAIGGSSDYDEALAAMLKRDAMAEPESLFEQLAIEDIRMATDAMRPVWERTKGADGYVSLEVSPKLAHETQKSIDEARRLWKSVDRPNLMIKIPSTPEGIPAVEVLLGEGINVNITLMFSLAHYNAVTRAFLNGLARCAKPERIASVASFFVSRVDTTVDNALEKAGTPEALALRGKIGIANSRRVYQRFREIFQGDAFAEWRRRGVRPQRVLWASTSTKNPAYRDVLYVEEMIGPDTVNTMPPQTLDAFADHGQVRGATIDQDPEQAVADLAALEKFGISLDAITEQLQVEGVASFAKSYEDLMATLDQKRKKILAGGLDPQSIHAGALAPNVEKRLAEWDQNGFSRRFWEKDYTLWSPTPVPEITDRMGWLDLPEKMHEAVADLIEFRERVRKDGFTHAVLLGMGGSSLAPEVFQTTFDNAPGCPELLALDSTHPAAVRAVEKRIDLKHTLFIVSSKSGTTTETLSFFRYFWSRLSGGDRGSQFVAITDPETPLEKLGSERGFRRVFRATADVGGRYSALTHFGLVPAAVIGVDLTHLLGRAWVMRQACAPGVPVRENPGVTLGALLGEAARAGRDKLTFCSGSAMAALPVLARATGRRKHRQERPRHSAGRRRTARRSLRLWHRSCFRGFAFRQGSGRQRAAWRARSRRPSGGPDSSGRLSRYRAGILPLGSCRARRRLRARHPSVHPARRSTGERSGAAGDEGRRRETGAGRLGTGSRRGPGRAAKSLCRMARPGARGRLHCLAGLSRSAQGNHRGARSDSRGVARPRESRHHRRLRPPLFAFHGPVSQGRAEHRPLPATRRRRRARSRRAGNRLHFRRADSRAGARRLAGAHPARAPRASRSSRRRRRCRPQTTGGNCPWLNPQLYSSISAA